MGRFYLALLIAAFILGIQLIAAMANRSLPLSAAKANVVPSPGADTGASAPPQPPQRSLRLSAADLTEMRLHNEKYETIQEDGTRITFTLDPELQETATELFTKNEVPAGAAVVLNSRTGRVLAFAQHRLAKDLVPDADVALDSSPPAASLFKIVTTAALLEQTEIEVTTSTCYRGGSRRLVLENLQDFPREKSACATLETALGRSINAVFAKLTDRHLTPGTLAQYAEKFGFNHDLPFDIPFEPSRAEIPLDRLERARTAAGFWHTHLSPLHAAMIMQSIAQGGAMLRPYIVKTFHDAEGTLLKESKPQFVRTSVSKQTASTLLRAMAFTVKRGTARKAFYDDRGVPFLPGVDVAGKTGTLNGQKPYRAFTWFAGVAPVNEPEISVAVLVVNEPKWRIKASYAAMLLIKKYFNTKRLKREGPG